MAESGSEISFVATVDASPVEIVQALAQALYSSGNYLEDTQVVPVGPTTIRITRRYVPTWAIVVAIVGFFLCLIGLLALLVRDTEVLTIDIRSGTGSGGDTGPGADTGSIGNTGGGTDAPGDVGLGGPAVGRPSNTVSVMGTGTSVHAMTIQGVLSRYPGYHPTVAATSFTSGFPAGSTPFAAQPWTGSVPAGAHMSPDGYYWWDGSTWRPVNDPTRPQGPNTYREGPSTDGGGPGPVL